MTPRVVRDDAFLRQAMRAHGASVLRLAIAQTGSRADAEDVYQDVFVALACCDTAFGDEGHLRAWLLRTTLNRCRDLARSWWRRHAQSFDALGLEVADAEKDEDPWTPAEIHLRYVEQMPADAIAAACGISESAVRTRLSRATQKLRFYLGGTS